MGIPPSPSPPRVAFRSPGMSGFATTMQALPEQHNYNHLPGFYDDGMIFGVDGTLFVNPDTTVDLTGNTVNTDDVVDIIPGVDAQLEYFFDPNRNVVRALFTLTNTTGADINTSVNFRGNYGSDGDYHGAGHPKRRPDCRRYRPVGGVQ